MGRKDRIEALEAQVEAWVVVADRRRRQRDAARRERDAARAEVERLTAELRGGDEFARQAAATPPDAPRRMQANPGTGPVHGVEHDENSWCSGVPCVPVEPESVEPEPTPVEVGDWFTGPRGMPCVVRDFYTGSDGVEKVKVEQLGHAGGFFWPTRSDLATWERCDPPTVEVAARDLVVGMREAGTGREITHVIKGLDTVAGGVLACVTVHIGPTREHRHPGAPYTIEVQSLPDGWVPSEQGEA